MVDLSGCAHDRWVRLDKARGGRNGDARHSSGRVIGMDRTEGHDAGLSSKGVYEAIAMSEPNNASHWTWTPEYHGIKTVYRRTFFLIGRQTSRTNTNRGLPRNTLHVTSHPLPCSPESAPRRWLGPENSSTWRLVSNNCT